MCSVFEPPLYLQKHLPAEQTFLSVRKKIINIPLKFTSGIQIKDSSGIQMIQSCLSGCWIVQVSIGIQYCKEKDLNRLITRL